MRSWRENPEGEESQRAAKQHEREVFALQMQSTIRENRIVECGELNERLKKTVSIWRAVANAYRKNAEVCEKTTKLGAHGSRGRAESFDQCASELEKLLAESVAEMPNGALRRSGEESEL